MIDKVLMFWTQIAILCTVQKKTTKKTKVLKEDVFLLILALYLGASTREATFSIWLLSSSCVWLATLGSFLAGSNAGDI